MNQGDETSSSVGIRALIKEAFGRVEMPGVHLVAGLEPPEDFEDARALEGVRISDIDVQFWRDHPDSLYGLGAEAFEYYLPSLLVAATGSGDIRMDAVIRLLDDLDRSASPDRWDCAFTRRWGGLGLDQLEAVKQWLLWLGEHEDDFHASALPRAYEVLVALQRSKGGG